MKRIFTVLFSLLFVTSLALAQSTASITAGGFNVPNPVVSSVTASVNAGGGSLAAGTWCYMVTAIDANGNETGRSADVCATTTGTTSQITVNWTSPGTFASTYRIYRGIQPGAEGTFFTSGSTSFVDTGGSTPTTFVPTTLIPAIGANNSYAASFGTTPSKVNGLTTVNNGMGVEVAKYDATAQGANISSQTLFTPTVSGRYKVTCYIVVTQAATTSSTMPSCVTGWSDADSTTAETNTLTATSTGNALTTYATATALISAKSGVAITLSTTGYVSSGATSMQYAVHAIVEAY